MSTPLTQIAFALLVATLFACKLAAGKPLNTTIETGNATDSNENSISPIDELQPKFNTTTIVNATAPSKPVYMPLKESLRGKYFGYPSRSIQNREADRKMSKELGQGLKKKMAEDPTPYVFLDVVSLGTQYITRAQINMARGSQKFSPLFDFLRLGERFGV